MVHAQLSVASCLTTFADSGSIVVLIELVVVEATAAICWWIPECEVA